MPKPLWVPFEKQRKRLRSRRQSESSVQTSAVSIVLIVGRLLIAAGRSALGLALPPWRGALLVGGISALIGRVALLIVVCHSTPLVELAKLLSEFERVRSFHSPESYSDRPPNNYFLCR